MPRVDAQSAVFFLQRGALGIGEIHTDSEGRQLVLDLMNQGVVKHLFLEIANTKYTQGGPTIYPEMIRQAQRVYDDPRVYVNVVEQMQGELKGIPEKQFFTPDRSVGNTGAARQAPRAIIQVVAEQNRIPIRKVIAL